jgi:hypothetical protein
MLKVPTIADRAWQCLAKYALEPACALQLSMHRAMGSEQDGQHMMPRKSFLSTLEVMPKEKRSE